MKSKAFDYHLPDELIAQVPVTPRDWCRLLVVDPASDEFAHKRFDDLVSILRPGDVIVRNDSRVVPARLFAEDEQGRRFELLLLEQLESDEHHTRWSCLVKPGKKVKTDLFMRFPHEGIGTVTREGENFSVSFPLPKDVFPKWLEKAGAMPLPPYVRRPANAEDREMYQTVYARVEGSIAAPTAGLHFTPKMLEALKEKGVLVEDVTLHVGYGTFAPLQTEEIEEHKMHAERFAIAPDAWQRILDAKASGGRVIAIGTTALRAVESVAKSGLSGSTDIFISPGFEFQVVNGLVTNFHLPMTSLLVLVAALLGREKMLLAYKEAITRRYRFYSYGDAMAIVPGCVT